VNFGKLTTIFCQTGLSRPLRLPISHYLPHSKSRKELFDLIRSLIIFDTIVFIFSFLRVPTFSKGIIVASVTKVKKLVLHFN